MLLVILILSLTADLSQCQKRPNIVFILSDDLGFNDVGYHGKNHYSEMETPFIDKLGSEGIRLENYYVQPVCTPTRGQLLTGLHPIHNGLQNGVIWPIQTKALPLDFKLLPEQLQACGYDTHMVGKWHLGFYKKEFLPYNRGFNSYFGFLASSQNYFSHQRCYKGYCGIDMHNSITDGPVNDTYGEYSTHLFTRKSIEAIKNGDREKPFFLYLSHQAVHIPVQAPHEYYRRFTHIKNKKRRKYAGMVSTLDESVRNVTEFLRSEGLLDNTIIVFSTDNGGITGGGGNNWPLRGGKRTLWEGGIRAVGFIHGKPLGVSGVTHKGLMDVSDWFPTLLTAAGCKVINGTQSLDGVDQWDSLRQLSPSRRTELLHTIGPYRRPSKRSVLHGFNTKTSAAIRRGPWKLITGNPGPDSWEKPPEYTGEGPKFFPGTRKGANLELFNIEDDPIETKNVAAQHPLIVEQLLKSLAMHSKSIYKLPRSDFDPASNPQLHGGFWRPWIK